MILPLQRNVCLALRHAGAAVKRNARPLTKRSISPAGNRCERSCTIRHFTVSAISKRSIDIVVPQMAESISEGTIAAFLKRTGDLVENDEEVATIETDKIDVSINAPENGRITEIFANEGDTVTVGQKIATMETEDQVGTAAENVERDPKTRKEPERTEPERTEPERKEPERKEKEEHENAPSKADMSTTATKSTQPSASEKRKDNVFEEEKSPASASVRSAVHETQHFPKTQVQPRPEENGPPRIERQQKIPRMRQTIARRLKDSQNLTASLTTMQRVDMFALMNWRKQYKEEVQTRHGVRLGYMGAFIRAATLAAQEVPEMNAAMDTEKGIITYRDFVDISVAVSTPKGLVTPVLRNCHLMDIIEIERGVSTLATKARDAKLTMDDLSGGNFTISNPGIFGSLFGTPIINFPQSAVFNMNSIKDEPVVVDGQIVIRPMMYITTTYDHRLIDGREAVRFLNIIRANIEDPTRMLFRPPML